MAKGRISIPGRNSKRGRPPTPVQESTWKTAATAMPQTPNELTGEALSEWNRLEPYLLALNRISGLDGSALFSYVTYWGRFASIMSRHFADDDAPLSADGPTCEVQHPLLPELIGYAKEMMRIAADFGMTARSRDLDGDHGNRLPSALKRFTGNRTQIAESKLPESVIPMLPKWERGDIDPPLWMNARAARIYRDVISQLETIDLFTPLDKVQITVLACLADLFMRANEQLQNDFTLVISKMTGEETYEKAHPLHKAIRDIGQVSHDYWTAYGMSPRARKIFAGERAEEKKERPLVFKGKFG